MRCDYCKGDAFFLKVKDDKTGVYCQNCGRWLKWVEGDDLRNMQDEIARKKREITIDGLDVEHVREKYKNYRQKYVQLSEEIRFYQDNAGKTKTMVETKAIYEKVLRLKELTAKIAAYEEVLSTLRLK